MVLDEGNQEVYFLDFVVSLSNFSVKLKLLRAELVQLEGHLLHSDVVHGAVPWKQPLDPGDACIATKACRKRDDTLGQSEPVTSIGIKQELVGLIQQDQGISEQFSRHFIHELIVSHDEQAVGSRISQLVVFAVVSMRDLRDHVLLQEPIWHRKQNLDARYLRLCHHSEEDEYTGLAETASHLCQHNWCHELLRVLGGTGGFSTSLLIGQMVATRDNCLMGLLSRLGLAGRLKHEILTWSAEPVRFAGRLKQVFLKRGAGPVGVCTTFMQ